MATIKGNYYFENLEEEIKQYFEILSEEIPSFLYDYIDTPEMKKQDGITTSCGTMYSKLFGSRRRFSSLDHSIAVALIIWNFTKSKKQTLAGLFHDISTPAFKHCIDFMNGDYEKQESTEELTAKIIGNSKQIMTLLQRDGIKIEEVADYHIYPIADNDIPKLSADRLEYTLSNGLGTIEKLWDLEIVKNIYQNVEVQINEEGIQELGFKDVDVAEQFVKGMSELSKSYQWNKTKLSMQFLADIMRKMSEKQLITKKDLYNLSEEQVIQKIKSCSYENISKCFSVWQNATEVKESQELINDKYCVGIQVKKRYIVPLVRNQNGFARVNQLSEKANQDIESFLNFTTKKYAYLDFQF